MDLLQRAEVAKRTADLATKILIDDLLKAAGLFQVAEPAPAPAPDPDPEPEPEAEPEAEPEDVTERPSDDMG